MTRSLVPIFKACFVCLVNRPVQPKASGDLAALVVRLVAVIKIPRVIRIHDDVPRAVQARRLPRENISDDRLAPDADRGEKDGGQGRDYFFHVNLC